MLSPGLVVCLNGGLVWILYIGLQGFPCPQEKTVSWQEKVPQDLKRSRSRSIMRWTMERRVRAFPSVICICLIWSSSRPRLSRGVVHILYLLCRNGLYLLDGQRQAAVKNHITYIQHGLGRWDSSNGCPLTFQADQSSSSQ